MKSKIAVICMLLLVLFCVSAVSAEDITSNASDATLTSPINETALTDSEAGFNDLQESINNAEDYSTIYLDKDYKNTQKSSIKLHKSLIIDGQGHSIDCDYKTRAIESKSGDITLKNLIIQKGDDKMGGAIYIEGSAKYTIINCTFIDNKASEGGGAIYNNAADKTLTIINSTFKDSLVELQKGGAIYSKGPVEATSSKFTNNRGTDGGAIYSESSVEATLSTFNSNRADGSRMNRANGGAICAKGMLIAEDCDFISNNARPENGGALMGYSIILVKNSRFKDNYAKEGGAIYKGSGDYIVVENSTFTSNRATSFDGGAIRAATTVILGNCTFKNNDADDKGGAVCCEYIEFDGGSRFISNTANDHGGAIYTDKISGTNRDLYFESNQVKADFGGAIYINKNSGNVNFYNSTFKANSAIKGDGGAIYSDSGSTTLILTGCVFSENYADAGTEKRYGGAVCAKGIVRVSNSTFYKNWAENRGGAIYSHKDVTISGYSSFIENYAKKEYGGAVFCTDIDHIENAFFDSNTADKGGAVYCSDINRIVNGIFQSNSAGYGGAVYCDHLTRVYDSAFISNRAGSQGGAIYINSKSDVSITKTYFESNTAGHRGGAIYSDSSSTSNLMTLNNNAFIDNNAGDQGKHVFNRGKYASIRGNWWGSNSPDFDHEQVMEYKVWGSNKEHSDSDIARISMTGPYSGEVDIKSNFTITFTHEVPTYLLNKIYEDLDHRGKGSFVDKEIQPNQLIATYIPKEDTTHVIHVKSGSARMELSMRAYFYTICAYDLVKTYGDSQVFTAIFKDGSGYKLKNWEVIFEVDGKQYTHTTSDEGIAAFTEITTLTPGTYTIKSINPFTKGERTNTITILPRETEYLIGEPYIVRFLNSSYENENVTFRVEDKEFTCNVTNSTAVFSLYVTAGEHTIDVYHNGVKINSIENVKVIDEYYRYEGLLNGENYAALLPIYANETFIIEGNVSYSELGDNLRRYIFLDGYGAIIYNVTASNTDELTNVLRKIASKDFRADIIIINLKPTTYKVTESFYRDQEWNYLMHLTTGSLFINGNGAVFDDGYHNNFALIESGVSVSIENVTFKKFYRTFVNTGNFYCSDCTFTENDARFFATDTPGSVIYNKNQATFANCVFDHNTNDNARSIYSAKLKASIYAEAKSLTNFIQCKFTEDDTIHAVDSSMVILYDDTPDNYKLFTKDMRNNFELGSCLDYRPVASYKANNNTGFYNVSNLGQFLGLYYNEMHSPAYNDTNYVINITSDATFTVSQYEKIASPNDFRTYNSKHTSVTIAGDKDDNEAHHRYLVDVGSKSVVINGNGHTISLTDSGRSDDNHFAFVPSYSSLTLINLTISGFNTAIVNYGQLIIINCTIKDNEIHYKRPHTFENEKGGAIRNYATAFFYNTTFANNRATEGGAYYSSGSSAYGQFYNCSFRDNTLISNLVWKNGDNSAMLVDQQSTVKIIKCKGITGGNVKSENNGLVLYRESLENTVLNYEVSSLYTLMKLSNMVNTNNKYDTINVTFTKGDYGVFPNTVLFKMGYGQLILSGNGARVFANTPKDSDETQFLVTDARSSVIITDLTIEGFNIAIENNGGLNILNSHFINNRVDYNVKKDYGGAIVNAAGATLTIFNTTFSGNYAKYGGAIYNQGTVTIIASSFTNNKGYKSGTEVDVYNNKASASIISLGKAPSVIDNYPMAAWKQKVITGSILSAVTILSAGAGFGISASITAATQLISLAVGAGIGAIGGTIDAVIYSNDNQDYGQFLSRVKEGVVAGIRGASIGMTVRNLIMTNEYTNIPEDFNGDVEKWQDYLINEKMYKDDPNAIRFIDIDDEPEVPFIL